MQMYPEYLYQNYSGKFVATEHFNDYKVIASGRNMKSAFNKAIAKGFKKPFVFYIPEKNIVNIYHIDS